jgi:hypothetical protein
VNVSYCDSRTAFLNDQVDYYVYCLLMSPDGKGVKMPGANTSLNTGSKSFALPLDDSWIP